MRFQWWLFLVPGAFVLELVLLKLRPTWLASLAFLPLSGVRRIDLPTPAAEPVAETGYREPAARTAPLRMPRLDLAPVDLEDDALLVASPSGSTLAVRHARVTARDGFLVQIRGAIEDGALVLRARQAWFPLAGLVMIAVFGAVVLRGQLRGFPLLLVAAATFGQVRSWYSSRAARDLAVERAYDAIEQAIRGPK